MEADARGPDDRATSTPVVRPVADAPEGNWVGGSLVGLARLAELSLSEVRLSLTQYRLLAYLRFSQSIQSSLAFKLSVTKQSVTRLVDGLVARGYVERGADGDDRRRVVHTITPAGEAIFALANEHLHGSWTHLLQVLPDADATAATDGMQLVAQALRSRAASAMERDRN